MNFLRTLFGRTGLLIVGYTLIGVFVNTAAPHLPPQQFTTLALHSWVQYFISIMFWPLSLWHPTFTVGEWH